MADLQEQIDALVRQMRINRQDIDALQLRADASEGRADESEARADAAEVRASIDRDMIDELQRDGVLSTQHATQMEEALKSSRTVGAAIGLIMASRDVSDEVAFGILRTASQNSNRKVRDITAELVASAVDKSGRSTGVS